MAPELDEIRSEVLFSVVWRSGQYLWSGGPGWWFPFSESRDGGMFSSDRGVRLLSLLGKFGGISGFERTAADSGPALVGLLRGVHSGL